MLQLRQAISTPEGRGTTARSSSRARGSFCCSLCPPLAHKHQRTHAARMRSRKDACCQYGTKAGRRGGGTRPKAPRGEGGGRKARAESEQGKPGSKAYHEAVKENRGGGRRRRVEDLWMARLEARRHAKAHRSGDAVEQHHVPEHHRLPLSLIRAHRTPPHQAHHIPPRPRRSVSLTLPQASAPPTLTRAQDTRL